MDDENTDLEAMEAKNSEVTDNNYIPDAQCVKNADSQQNVCIDWLAADFIFLISATPIVSGVLDCEGPLKLFQRKDAAQQWTKEGLAQLGYDEDINPFKQSTDSEAYRVLRPTLEAFRRFIVKAPLLTQGAYVERLWAGIMIRRVYSTSILPDAETTIGRR